MRTREIKFRGKRLDNGEWVYGDLGHRSKVTEYGLSPATTVGRYDVDPATVGQFTGLHDANGKEIYEGDIVLQQGYNGKKQPMEVRFDCGAFIVGYHSGSSTKRTPMLLNSRCKILGNVFDNPELLKGGQE